MKVWKKPCMAYLYFTYRVFRLQEHPSASGAEWKKKRRRFGWLTPCYTLIHLLSPPMKVNESSFRKNFKGVLAKVSNNSVISLGIKLSYPVSYQTPVLGSYSYFPDRRSNTITTCSIFYITVDAAKITCNLDKNLFTWFAFRFLDLIKTFWRKDPTYTELPISCPVFPPSSEGESPLSHPPLFLLQGIEREEPKETRPLLP